MDLQEVGFVDWIELARGRTGCGYLVNAVMNLGVRKLRVIS